MMYRNSFNKIRSIEPDIVKYYEININDYEPITLKAYKIVSDNGKEYFLKETKAVALQKYQYLYNQGVNNVIYPILNRNESFVTRANDSNYYISDYVKQIKIRNDTRVSNLYNELSILHHQRLQYCNQNQLQSFLKLQMSHSYRHKKCGYHHVHWLHHRCYGYRIRQ